jgi:adenylosuccinate lyase
LLANSILELFSRKLPVSRMQRDLTDSTLLRNVGSAFAYTLIGLKSLHTGLDKIDINEPQIMKELNKNHMVIAEALQSKMKVLGIENSYEKIKKITRTNLQIDKLKLEITKFINDLDISIEEKEKLLNLTPSNYTGIFL